jgi:MFS family permease
MFGAIVFLPLFLQVVMGASPTNSGLLLLPLMGGVVTSSIVTGRLITRTGRYKVYPIVGTALMSLGLWLLSTMSPATTLLQASIYMLAFGIGMGGVLQVLVIAVQNAVEARDLGVATSSATFFRSLGGSFGTALFGAILTSQLVTRLAPRLTSGSVGDLQDLTGSPELISQLAPEVRSDVVDAFSHAITAAFSVAIPFLVLGLLLVIVLPEIPLRDTAHVGPSESPITPGAVGH